MMFMVSMLRQLQGDNIPKDNLGQQAIHFSLRLETIDSILRFFLLLMHSATLRIVFSDCLNKSYNIF